MIRKETVIRAIENDKSAMEEIYTSTYSSGYALAYSILKSKEDAEDVLQDAYLSAFTNLSSLKNKSAFDSWFKMIIANKSKSFLTKKKPTLFSDVSDSDNSNVFVMNIQDEDAEVIPEEKIDRNDTKSILNMIMEHIPDDQRICLLMYYGEQLKISDIATALEVSVNTVKSRLSYGKKKLKAEVLNYESKGYVIRSVAGISMFAMLRFFLNSITVPASNSAAVVATASAANASGAVISNVAFSTAANTALGVKIAAIAIGTAILGTGGFVAAKRILPVDLPPAETVPVTETEEASTSEPTEETIDYTNIYKDFVLNEEYKQHPEVKPDSGNDMRDSFSVCDVDFDGVPELIVNNGAAFTIGADGVNALFFDYIDDKITYIGKLPSYRYGYFLSDTKEYPYLFLSYQGLLVKGVPIKDGTIGESVFVSQFPFGQVQTFYRTPDDGLFNAAMSANSNIVGFSRDDIMSMGWEEFVKQSIYVRENEASYTFNKLDLDPNNYEIKSEQETVYDDTFSERKGFIPLKDGNVFEFPYSYTLEFTQDYAENVAVMGAGSGGVFVYKDIYKENNGTIGELFTITWYGEEELYKIDGLNYTIIEESDGNWGKSYLLCIPPADDQTVGCSQEQKEKYETLLAQKDKILATYQSLR